MKKQMLAFVVFLQASALYAGLGYSIAHSADYGHLNSPMHQLIAAINNLDTREARRLIEQDETLLAQYLDLFREKESHLRLVGTSPLESMIREEDPRSVDMLALLLEKGINPDGFWRCEPARNNLGGVLECNQPPKLRHQKILLLLKAGVDPVPIDRGEKQDFFSLIDEYFRYAFSPEQKKLLQDAYADCCAEHEKREAAPLKAEGAALARILPDALHDLLPVPDLYREIGEYVNTYYGWPEEIIEEVIDESKSDY